MSKFVVTILTYIIASVLSPVNLSLAVTRTLTIKNNCDRDMSIVPLSVPMKNSQGDILKCTNDDKYCNDFKGYCGKDRQCYYQNIVIKFGKDNYPDNYLRKEATKIYDVELVDIDNTLSYGFKMLAVTGCRYSDDSEQCEFMKCLASNLNWSANSCLPSKEYDFPYNTAQITFNHKTNDKYLLSAENGINQPLSIKPIGDFGKQSVVKDLFCSTSGEGRCQWKFSPYSDKNIKKHVFIQIERDIDNDVTTLCQSTTDCPNEQYCGLKYPEDLKNYASSGYCGKPVGYYNIVKLCGLDFVSNSLKKLFDCQNNSPDKIDTSDLVLLERDFDLNIKNKRTLKKTSAIRNTKNNSKNKSKEEKAQDRVFTECPNSFTELKLKGIADSVIKVCNYEIFTCQQKTITINGYKRKYLDSCYNYNQDSPEITACCGCIDWPGVASNEDYLCKKNHNSIQPNPCVIDFGLSPPECKPKFNTAISSPNMFWKKLVSPYLNWIIQGCPEFKEYKYGDKHATIECSSQDENSYTSNNINYIITLCPNDKQLFSTKTISKNEKITPSIDSSFSEKRIVRSRFNGGFSLSTFIILVTFLLISFGLVYYFYSKRDQDN